MKSPDDYDSRNSRSTRRGRHSYSSSSNRVNTRFRAIKPREPHTSHVDQIRIEGMCIRQDEQVVSFDLIGPEAGNMGRENVEWDVGRLTRVKESARKLIFLREILRRDSH